CVKGIHGRSQSGIQRRKAGRDGRESSGQDPRDLFDVVVEQVWLAGVEHRQQERNQYRLLYPLRRYGWGICFTERCDENDGVSIGGVLQANPAPHYREAAIGGIAAGSAGYRFPSAI